MTDQVPMEEVLHRLKRIKESRENVFAVLERHNINFDTHNHLMNDLISAMGPMWEATHKRLPGEEVWPRVGWYPDEPT